MPLPAPPVGAERRSRYRGPASPVKFFAKDSEADLTGVAPGDGTGVGGNHRTGVVKNALCLSYLLSGYSSETQGPKIFIKRERRHILKLPCYKDTRKGVNKRDLSVFAKEIE